VKWDKWPSPEEHDLGYRFVDPSRERLSDHIELRGTELVALTRAGEYTIEELELNLGVHPERRERRLRLLKLVYLLEVLIEHCATKGIEVPDGVREALAEAQRNLGLIQPLDAPTSCLCRGIPQLSAT
jgi:GNAT superfamily N-acetyltransferase